MTSNSISQLPAAFLDRCKVVEVGYPTPDQLVRVGRHMMQTRLPEDMWDIGEDAISQAIFAKHSPTSLRMVERMSDSIVDVLLRPWLM
jgi:MoxR-like ATPase